MPILAAIVLRAHLFGMLSGPRGIRAHRLAASVIPSDSLNRPFDLELIRVLSITYQLSLAHFVLRSSANVNSYLMYVKPGQGQNLVEVARGRHPWRTGQPEDILKNATGLGIAAFVPRS